MVSRVVLLILLLVVAESFEDLKKSKFQGMLLLIILISLVVAWSW